MVNDTSQNANEVLIGIYRKMSAEAKLLQIFDAYQTGKMLAFAGLKERYPRYSEKEIWKLWAKQHLGEQLYNKVYNESRT